MKINAEALYSLSNGASAFRSILAVYILKKNRGEKFSPSKALLPLQYEKSHGRLKFTWKFYFASQAFYFLMFATNYFGSSVFLLTHNYCL